MRPDQTGARRQLQLGAGCLDPVALTYDPTAFSHDNAACTYPIHGCTDSLNQFYMSQATAHNASACAPPTIPGCTAASAPIALAVTAPGAHCMYHTWHAHASAVPRAAVGSAGPQAWPRR